MAHNPQHPKKNSGAFRVMPGDDNKLLESPEDRIFRMEELMNQLVPSLARMEAKMDSLVEDVHTIQDDVRHIGSENHKRDISIRTLIDDAASNKSARAARSKWLGGVVATVLAALILALFGLK
jgi:t-SNARE complex subunit (syntaxin)